MDGTYLLLVVAEPEVRREQFTRFVNRAVSRARIDRGWTTTRILEAAGPNLSRSTLYRWLRGDLDGDPLAGQVLAFCDALDIDPVEPFKILWPGKDHRPAATEPIQLNPDLETLARRMNDPNVPEHERYMIREVLRSLAARTGRASRPAGREEKAE